MDYHGSQDVLNACKVIGYFSVEGPGIQEITDITLGLK